MLASADAHMAPNGTRSLHAPSSGTISSIAIVILNWNQEADTAECLVSLREVAVPKFQIILVDNGSSDGSPDRLARQFPDALLIRNRENLGYAGGNNVGIRVALESGAEFVLLLNNDTVVQRDFLCELMKAAESRPDVGIWGAKVTYYDRPGVLWALGGNVEQPFGRIRMLGRNEPADRIKDEFVTFDHVPGAVMFVRADVFRQIGLLDSEFFLNWEDAEFCLRAQDAGWKIAGAPKSVVQHKVSRATAGRLATYFGQRNRLLFTSKRFPRWQFVGVIVPFHLMRLIHFIALELLRGRTDVAKAAALGTWDFFCGRLGPGRLATL